MSVRPALSEKIESTLKTFLNNGEPFTLNFDEPIDLKALAAELNVLPITLNFSSCYAIRPSGEVILLDFDENDVYGLIEMELDPRIRALVLCQGAKRYPELKELKPERPERAHECPTCNGTGVDPINQTLGFDKESIVCYCGGLGWLPKNDDWASLFE